MFFYQSGIVNPAEQRSDILRRCLFLRRAYLFAWGCVSWQGWPLGSLETDRRAVRSWAGWEWAGLVGREQQQVARPTIDSGNSQAHGLNHVLALWGLILLWRKKSHQMMKYRRNLQAAQLHRTCLPTSNWKNGLAWTSFERNADIWDLECLHFSRDHQIHDEFSFYLEFFNFESFNLESCIINLAISLSEI